MYLLTSKYVFDNVFGNKLHMFSAQTNNEVNTNNKEATMKYLDLWKLEILLDVWHDYFIGSTGVDTDISVQVVCGHIAQLKHLCINKNK